MTLKTQKNIFSKISKKENIADLYSYLLPRKIVLQFSSKQQTVWVHIYQFLASSSLMNLWDEYIGLIYNYVSLIND